MRFFCFLPIKSPRTSKIATIRTQTAKAIVREIDQLALTPLHSLSTIIAKNLGARPEAREAEEFATAEYTPLSILSLILRGTIDKGIILPPLASIEKPTNSFLYSLVMDTYSFGYNASSFVDMPISHKVFLAQFDTIKKIADEGPCVIVGRNADYILKDRDDALHVYIHADMDYRTDRIVRLYGESEKSPEARLQEKDKRRRVNYQHYSGREWGQAQNYDICLNSSTLGIEQCVALIVNMAK